MEPRFSQLFGHPKKIAKLGLGIFFNPINRFFQRPPNHYFYWQGICTAMSKKQAVEMTRIPNCAKITTTCWFLQIITFWFHQPWNKPENNFDGEIYNYLVLQMSNGKHKTLTCHPINQQWFVGLTSWQIGLCQTSRNVTVCLTKLSKKIDKNGTYA